MCVCVRMCFFIRSIKHVGITGRALEKRAKERKSEGCSFFMWVFRSFGTWGIGKYLPIIHRRDCTMLRGPECSSYAMHTQASHPFRQIQYSYVSVMALYSKFSRVQFQPTAWRFAVNRAVACNTRRGDCSNFKVALFRLPFPPLHIPRSVNYEQGGMYMPCIHQSSILAIQKVHACSRLLLQRRCKRPFIMANQYNPSLDWLWSHKPFCLNFKKYRYLQLSTHWRAHFTYVM